MVSICRLCASLKKTENLTFIRDNNHDLCQKLNKCCQLSIDLKDVLPKGVCPDCIRCLNVSFEFYEKVHESQQSLQKLLNVETNSKVEDTVSNDGVISEDRNALVLMAATASTGSDETTEEEAPSLQEVHEALTANDNDSNDTKQDFTEIICVKDEKSTYLILNSEATESKKIVDLTDENEIDEGTINPNNFFSPSAYGIEFIDEDVEAINFEQSQYQIIEEFEDEEGSVEEQIQYIAQQTEEKVPIEEEKSNDGTARLSADLTISTWLDYPWKCVQCGEGFSTAKKLIEHHDVAHQMRIWDIKWVCADCLKDFTRYYALINHIRQRHRSNLALLCDVCNEPQQNFKCLEEHRQQTHKDEEFLIMLMCSTCGKGFHTTNSLQIHSKCHLPDDLRLRYSCDLCDKKFRTVSNLKFHQKMHAGTRDFICDQCGKNFAQRANLEEHLVTHITFTPYECSLCHQFFKTPERLTRHKLRHTDEKPFSCTECKKTFRTKDAMTTHMRIHTGEMPFSCEFCFKPFRFRSTLMTHHNVHTGTRPYACLDCNHHFTNWPNYNKHMKRRHGIDVSSKNPRGKKPSKPAKPLKKPKKPLTSATTTTTESHFIVKLKADQEIRVENADGNEEEEEENEDIATEYEPEEDINITVAKQEEETPGDNYEDAI